MEKEKNWETAELRAIVGEDTWHSILANIGGMRIQIPVPSEETVVYYYQRGYTANEIAFRLRMSYSRVSEIITKNQRIKHGQ